MKSLIQTLSQQFMTHPWIFVVIKPGFIGCAKEIINIFKEHGWSLQRTRTKQLLLREAKLLYKAHQKEDFYDSLCKYMSSDLSTGLIFTKGGELNKNDFKEVDEIKDYIRKKYGESDMRNVIHSSDSLSNMELEASIYF